MYIQKFKPDFLRNYCADLNQISYESFQVQGNENLMTFYPGVTLNHFTARSNLIIYAFLKEKVKTVDFSETIPACDLKVGRCRQLIEFMKVCEY